MPEEWTAGRAQAALKEIVRNLAVAVERLEEVYRRLPAPSDLADREEHRQPYNVATEVLSAIECVLDDDLRPAIESLLRAAKATDEQLELEFREQKYRRTWH